MITLPELRLLCPKGRVYKNRSGFVFRPFVSGDRPVAPVGYMWWHSEKSKTERYYLTKLMTRAEWQRCLLQAREPGMHAGDNGHCRGRKNANLE